MLWEGYPKEEASWVPREDVTLAAIRYGRAHIVGCMLVVNTFTAGCLSVLPQVTG